jgi:hypothetical protein
MGPNQRYATRELYAANIRKMPLVNEQIKCKVELSRDLLFVKALILG